GAADWQTLAAGRRAVPRPAGRRRAAPRRPQLPHRRLRRLDGGSRAGRALHCRSRGGGAMNFVETLTSLIERRDLDADTMPRLVEGFIDGSCGETEMAALLVALCMKGETAAELAAAASVLRQRMVPLEVGGDALDTCGTGGDGSATFNISTATAFVVAAAG